MNEAKKQVTKQQKLDKQETEKWKESVNLNKELHKLVLGLATGTLVFSVTFIDKLAPQMLYKYLLAIGWGSLLVSILASVAFISLLFRHFIFYKSFLLTFQDFLTLRERIKNMLKKKFQEESSWSEDFAKEFVDSLMNKKFVQHVAKEGLFCKDRPDLIEKEKTFARIWFIFLSELETINGKDEVEGAEIRLIEFLKSIRQMVMGEKVITILGYVSQGAFFVGIFFIAIFGFLNF